MARFLINDVYKISGLDVIPVGKITKGSLTKGMRAQIEEKTFEITSIEKKHQRVHAGNEGDEVGIMLKIVSRNEAPMCF